MNKLLVDLFLGLLSGGICAMSLLRTKKTTMQSTTLAPTKHGTIKAGIFNTIRFSFYGIGLVFLLQAIVVYPVCYMTCFFSGYWFTIYRYGVPRHEN